MQRDMWYQETVQFLEVTLLSLIKVETTTFVHCHTHVFRVYVTLYCISLFALSVHINGL